MPLCVGACDICNQKGEVINKGMIPYIKLRDYASVFYRCRSSIILTVSDDVLCCLAFVGVIKLARRNPAVLKFDNAADTNSLKAGVVRHSW